METEFLLKRLGDPELRRRAAEWLSIDTHPETLNEAKKLLQEASEESLKKLFLGKLTFGTAGLRAPMGAGFTRLNDVTIQQASQGLCTYLLKRHGEESCKTKGVVIGRDARYNSERFSHLAAATFLCRGFKVYLFHETVHTPLIPFSLRKLGCLAGIMVTASHNPKEYNGYKVYDSNGVQILSPVDTHIAQSIDANLVLWEGVERVFDRTYGRCCENRKQGSGILEDPREKMISAYLSEMTEDLCSRRAETEKTDLKVVYTSLHGVGFPFVKQLLEQFGFPPQNLIPVLSQCEPDPEFSTVSFPNPEEAGALDRAIELADKQGASLVIANDPDADRFACAEKFKGQWRQFTGDEIGILLASYLKKVRARQGIPNEEMLFVCSIVSSKMLKAFAEAEGCLFAETPTGFKWLGNKAAELQEEKGLFPVFVYEEALGYASSPRVRDKDGVSAAAVFVELASELYGGGGTVTEGLAALHKRLGYFVTYNGYKVAAADKQQKAVAWLKNGGLYHRSFGAYTVRSLRDVASGYDSAAPEAVSLFPRAGGDIITLRFEGGATLTLRPSGTEPKFKWYAEVCCEHPEKGKLELENIVDAVVRALPLQGA